MKNKLLLFFCSLFTLPAFAQIPEDVLKYSWITPGGTARNLAIGGAMGSLGGDITAIFTNPAGLGFYKTSELVISPGLSGLRNKSNFRGDVTSVNKSAFNLGTTGFVFGFNDRGSKWASKAFSIAVTRTANFNSHLTYEGKNNFSSYGEAFAIEAANSGKNLADLLNDPNVSLQTRMAVYSYLVDTLSIPGHAGQDLISMALRANLKKGAGYLVNQRNNIETKGGVTELAFGFAANMDDALYVGGSLGVPIVNYEKRSTFRETDATGNNNNDFDYSELQETTTTKGVGFNLKLGIIVKPAESFRLGLAIHSPTLYGLKDTYEATMTTNTENYPPSPGSVTVTSANTFTNGVPAQYKYDLVNPWRVMVSGSYVLHEVEDVKQQKGFLTADIEYVNYKSNHLSGAEDEMGNSSGDYSGVNEAIKSYYKSAFNFRVGGELKFTTIMARLGFAYYGNPYKDKSELKGRKMMISGGLGYRNKGIFIDLTGVMGLNRDVHFPYRLDDKANTFAAIKQNATNVALTFGFKF